MHQLEIGIFSEIIDSQQSPLQVSKSWESMKKSQQKMFGSDYKYIIVSDVFQIWQGINMNYLGFNFKLLLLRVQKG